MGIVNRLAKPKFIQNFLAVTDERAFNPSLWNLIGAQSLSGENVNEGTALTYSAVWNAVSLISGTISTLPLDLLRNDQNKTKQVTEKQLFHVLHSKFNKYMTAQVGREVMAAHTLTWGNAYAEKVFNGYGEIVELWPVTPNRVQPWMENGELVYKINVLGNQITLGRDKILHIPGLGFDGYIGYSVIALARKAIGLGMAMETFGSLFFGKGTHPTGIISHPQTLKDPKAYREAFSEIYGGLGQAQQVMLLQEGMKFETIGIPNEDSQFLEGRVFQVDEIARWFNIPVHKLKEMSKSSFNNIESEQTSYAVDTILPWLIRIEQNYDCQLLTDPERTKQLLYTRHNMDGLLRGSVKDRAEYYRVMWNIGAFTQNDIRQAEHKDPLDSEFADVPFVPLNCIPSTMLREYLQNQQKTPQISQKPPETGTGGQ